MKNKFMFYWLFSAMILAAIALGLYLKEDKPKAKFPFDIEVFGISSNMREDTMCYSMGTRYNGMTLIYGWCYRSPNHYDIGDVIRINSYTYGDDCLLQWKDEEPWDFKVIGDSVYIYAGSHKPVF